MVTIRAFRGHYSPEEHRGMEVPGIYWHFVDIMWVIVYTTVYVHLARPMLNPLRSEAEVFRLLISCGRRRRRDRRRSCC